jgi:hypothetical protein
MCLDPANGGDTWIDRMGTREAIVRDGLAIDPRSLAYCPHEWIDESGYVDMKLVQQSPRPFSV